MNNFILNVTWSHGFHQTVTCGGTREISHRYLDKIDQITCFYALNCITVYRYAGIDCECENSVRNFYLGIVPADGTLECYG